MLWKVTTALHASAMATAALHPHYWPWALGAVAANHVTITAAGLCPRCSLLGPNWTRLPRARSGERVVSVSIDDGPDPATTPRVLDILERHGATATFFCIGRRVARHRALTREIVDRGHDVENHSFSHPHYFSLLGPRAIEAELLAAQEVIATVTGRAPRFFRSPAGLRNPFLEPALRRLDLRLVSWTRRGFDTVTSNPDRVVRRLVRSLSSGDILVVHDGNSARDRTGRPVIFEILPRLLDRLSGSQLMPVTLRSALASTVGDR
jgi:peptidoglycan/xylan/chitin deacetylase (PgdA/CDA1 family)